MLWMVLPGWLHGNIGVEEISTLISPYLYHETREVIHTNKKHPFLTVEKGFLPVGQITLGMHVVEADGQVGVISGWKVVPGVMTMYNLEVALDHTFTVGVGEWVVHNCGDSPSPDELSAVAKEPSNSTGYSNAGRALAKHLGNDRWDRAKWEFLMPSERNPEGYNQEAENFVDDIITNPKTIWKTGKGGYIDAWESTEEGARGVAWRIVDEKLRFTGFK